MQFKVGDWVQLNQVGRDYVMTITSGYDPDLQKVFLGQMQISQIITSTPNIALFNYPTNFRLSGKTYAWSFDWLELAGLWGRLGVIPTTSQCQCPITLLMNRGCQCGSLKVKLP